MPLIFGARFADKAGVCNTAHNVPTTANTESIGPRPMEKSL